MKMQSIIPTIFASLLCLTLVQCKSAKDAAKPLPTESKENNKKGNPNTTLDINSAYAWPGGTDPFRVLSAEVTSDDSLRIEVEYGGGCEEHQFKLMTNGNLKKSLPPQCTLYLEHENNDDRCRALLRQKLAFYIGHLAKDSETIVIQLHDYTPETGKLVLNPGK